MRTRQEISSHSSQEGCFLNEAVLPERRMELDKSIYVGPTETLELPENLTLRIQSERGIQAYEGFWILTAAAASLESFKPNAKLKNCSEPRPNLEKKPKTQNPKPLNQVDGSLVLPSGGLPIQLEAADPAQPWQQLLLSGEQNYSLSLRWDLPKIFWGPYNKDPTI